jgi:hypothetical protein
VKIYLALLLLIVPSIAYADHITAHNEITIHKMNEFYDRLDDIYIFSLYVQSPDDPKCITGYAINDKGTCTKTEYHYDVYVAYLVTSMPEDCSQKLYCFKNKGVYLQLGHESLLWEIVTKLKR